MPRGRFSRWCRKHPVPSVAGVALLVVFVVVGLVTGRPASRTTTAFTAPTQTVGSAPPAVSTLAHSPTPRPPTAVTSVPADGAPAAGRSALVLLSSLPIKGRAPNTGYSRDQFGPAWTDDNDDLLGRNGCDTRNDILRRDLTSITVKANSNDCTVLSGVLLDPYTATTITFTRGTSTSSRVQIDHVVALNNAWQTGAQQWDAQQRRNLANDPLNLLAVDGSANQAKGSGDAATWLPPNKSYRCAYTARQIAVKARYGLWVTPAEHDALARILATCPQQPAPAEPGPLPVTNPAPVHGSPTTDAPASKPPPANPSGPPAAASAQCNDGSYSYAAHHQGACSGHGGVASFYR